MPAAADLAAATARPTSITLADATMLSQRRAMSREVEDNDDLGLVYRDRCRVPDRAWRRGGAGLESALAQYEGGHA